MFCRGINMGIWIRSKDGTVLSDGVVAITANSCRVNYVNLANGNMKGLMLASYSSQDIAKCVLRMIHAKIIDNKYYNVTGNYPSCVFTMPLESEVKV